MKKGYGLFLIVLAFMMIKGVSAASYYYVNDEGRYMLCAENGGCIEISQDESLATFNLGKGIIEFNHETYYYNSAKEEEYQEGQAGKTRMYFYKDSSGRYVLCSTNEKKSCRTYTFDKLKDIASISPNKIIINNKKGPGEEGDTYYLNQSMQQSVSNGSDGQTTSTDSAQNQTLQPTTDTCTRLKEPLRFVGHIVLVFKIVIPIVLLFLGALDFFRAITSSKDEEIKKSARSFAFRVISAVVIFFLPTIVSVLFSFVDSWAGIRGDFNACQKCVLRVGECQ